MEPKAFHQNHFIPVVILGIIDLIRSYGRGKLIKDEESWSYKLTKYMFD